MLKGQNKTIVMDEGDYGLSLPFKIIGSNVLSTDVIKFRVKQNENDETTIIEKDYTNLSQEEGKFVFDLSFSENETTLLPAGNYKYGVKQYRNGEFLNTIRDSEEFIVNKGV